MLSIDDWRRRFLVQAGWTRALRQNLAQQVGWAQAHRILEVGCGTGAVLAETAPGTGGALFGLDLRPDFLQTARESVPTASFTCGDGLHLPFRAGAYDSVFCHYLLLWVSNPVQILAEMKRVTRPGGWVLAFAEPDYAGRLDYPPELETTGRLQTQALRSQGADPFIGRRLRSLFARNGFVHVSAGALSGYWGEPPSRSALDSEWKILENDLASLVPAEALKKARQIDQQAWQSGERILFVPTFYACGQVPPDLRA
jgi:ubiquinone/menaquinone biosynthesis C-methylase UbiE